MNNYYLLFIERDSEEFCIILIIYILNYLISLRNYLLFNTDFIIDSVNLLAFITFKTTAILSSFPFKQYNPLFMMSEIG